VSGLCGRGEEDERFVSECVCVSVCVDGVSELVIESVSAADAGTYQCFVSNVAGTASALMTVNVQPSDQQSSHMQNISPHGTWCSHAHTHTRYVFIHTYSRYMFIHTHTHSDPHTRIHTHGIRGTCSPTHTQYVFIHSHTHMLCVHPHTYTHGTVRFPPSRNVGS